MDLHRTIAAHDEDHVTALTVEALGTIVALVAPPPMLAELRVALADLATTDAADRELTLAATERGFDLCDGGRVVRREVQPSVAVATLVWRLNAIAGESTAHVLLHAGCVAGGRGGGVLLIGGTGAGKSTLAAACVAGGLTYLSDELAAVDLRTGCLAPYPKPLGLDRERLVRASSLGAVATRPATPAALVFPRYEPGATVTETPLDGGWALLALAAHATNLATLGGTALGWLAGLAVECPAWQLTYGDARQAAGTVRRMALAPGRPVAPVETLPAIARNTTTVAVDDGLAVLHQPSGKVHFLNATAADVWRRETGVPTTATLTTDPVMTSATVDELVRAGLLADAAGT
jgi:hypothetical protein